MNQKLLFGAAMAGLFATLVSSAAMAKKPEDVWRKLSGLAVSPVTYFWTLQGAIKRCPRSDIAEPLCIEMKDYLRTKLQEAAVGDSLFNEKTIEWLSANDPGFERSDFYRHLRAFQFEIDSLFRDVAGLYGPDVAEDTSAVLSPAERESLRHRVSVIGVVMERYFRQVEIYKHDLEGNDDTIYRFERDVYEVELIFRCEIGETTNPTKICGRVLASYDSSERRVSELHQSLTVLLDDINALRSQLTDRRSSMSSESASRDLDRTILDLRIFAYRLGVKLDDMDLIGQVLASDAKREEAASNSTHESWTAIRRGVKKTGHPPPEGMSLGRIRDEYR